MTLDGGRSVRGGVHGRQAQPIDRIRLSEIERARADVLHLILASWLVHVAASCGLHRARGNARRLERLVELAVEGRLVLAPPLRARGVVLCRRT